MSAESTADRLVEWLQEEVRAAGCRGLVFGLSGGIDSSVVAVLAKRAFREEHLGLIMPIHSDPGDKGDALLLVEQFHLKYRDIDLSAVFDAMLNALGESPGSVAPADLPINNMKPRLRMATLYCHAARQRYLVAGTGNRSELTIGYFTKYGDGGVDLLPLGHLVKHEVRDLAEHLGVPRSIIEKPPSAGMWKGQTDEAELGFSYEELDRYLVEGTGKDQVAERIEQLRRSNAHKLRIPKMPPPAARD
jgi:NAD+ synthase